MPAFNFKSQFAAPIAFGDKIQTIRSTQRCQRGDAMHLFTGLRTKRCIKLAVRPCILVEPVYLTEDGITFQHPANHPADDDEFARLDGFPDYAAMWTWFCEVYSWSHFSGFVHRWAREPVSVTTLKRDGVA